MFDFWKDLEKAKKVEKLALGVFQSQSKQYQLIDVSDIKEYYHKGDLKAIAPDGKEYILEIKADSRIHETGNVLCEEQVLFYDTGKISKGNMYSDYQYYCVVSEAARKIAVIDFQVMRAHYKNNHKYITIKHRESETEAYLFPLKEIKELGGLIALLDY